MARIALALPLALEDRMAEDAVRHGHEVVARTVSALELASLVGPVSPDIVIAASEPRYLTDRVLASCDEAGVRLIALAADDAGRRHAATLGVFEAVDAASPWLEIERVIAGAGREPSPPQRRAERGSVIAVWGPAGSPGRTTIAIGIAAELAAMGHSVALADVDTHGASIAPALGMLDEAPGFAAACRLAGNDTLSQSELERISQRYESTLGGFWVLTGIGRPSRWPELSGERVAATIAQCRTWVDYTILDTSASLENDEEISSDLFAPRRNAAAVTAVREADSIVAVGSADPVGLSRFLRAHVDLIETASTNDVTVVMNRIRASAIGLNPHAQVTQTLSRFGGIESPVLVPHDQAGLDGAILSGRTLADSAPRSPARAAIRSMVSSRLVPEPPAQPRSLRSRFRLARATG
ncbi:MinD-like ATPase involved in chromosome partitioning or flagellar assembly [Salinibacterium sp. CAN_S4]|uniref:AAA family ATPase n=1 Tax=Salinibacterium sp. CAN_S4 TaxID=2787727 RepID=UPI0018F02C27